MPVAARLASINLSRGGVPKTPVFEARVTADGLEGDRHRFAYHGGADRAVILYSLEVIDALRREGHPIGVGTTGENLTLSGADWAAFMPGAMLAIGAVRLQITKYTAPCATIVDSLLGGDVSRIAQKQHPGWSRVCARILAPGVVRVGDEVTLIRSALTG